MSAQVLASEAETLNVTAEVRRSANFSSSVWADHLLSCASLVRKNLANI